MLQGDPALRDAMGARGHQGASTYLRWPEDARAFVAQLEQWAGVDSGTATRAGAPRADAATRAGAPRADAATRAGAPRADGAPRAGAAPPVPARDRR